MRLAIDIDSTLHPYWDQLAEIAQRRFGVALPYERQFTWAIPQLEPEQLQRSSRRPTAREQRARRRAVSRRGRDDHRWHEQGHFIHITATAPSTRTPTPRSGWTQIGLPHDELYCSDDKISRCVELEIDVLIDDSPVNLRKRSKRV